MARKGTTRRSIFNIMNYLYHPTEKNDDGTPKQLWSVEDIIRGTASKQIEKWAYIVHDKDVWLPSDEAANPSHKAGETKPEHAHLVIKMRRGCSVEADTIADWFHVPLNFIEFPRGGERAFLDCVEYLTHEREEQQAKGKHRYDDSEVHANFNWRDALNKVQDRRLKTGRDLSPKEYMRLCVMDGELTLSQAYQIDPVAYVNDDVALKRLRLKYISDVMTLPRYRENYYIEGAAGMGKDVLSRALARSLVSRDKTPEEMEMMSDDEIFFVVGDKKTTFEGYDGQPVIIWSDCRGSDMLARFGFDRGQLFNTLDKIPKKTRQNVKFSSVVPKNTYNIVNSVQSWKQWVGEICGSYVDRDGNKHEAEDLIQGLRRLDGWLCLHAEDYDFGFNTGLFDGTFDFSSFYVVSHNRGSFAQIARLAGVDYETRDFYNELALQPWTEQREESKGSTVKMREISDRDKDEKRKQMEDMFSDYGTGGVKSVDNPEEFGGAREEKKEEKDATLFDDDTPF